MKQYDPQLLPDSEAWLALDEADQVEMNIQYHRRARIKLPNAALHAAMYALMFLLVAVISTPVCLAGETTDEVSLEALPPSVVRTVPLCGDAAVDPDLREISVTFSKDMKVTGHCWSWCSVQEDSFPELSGDTEYLGDNRTCVLHVTLKPEKTYAIWINVDQFQSFQDPEGHPAVPYLLVFRTGPGE